MVTFELVSQQDCTVGGIGLLKAGEPVRLTNEQLNAFEVVHGYPLKDANFSSGVEVTVILLPDEEEGGEE
jgi:hypothetical protein